MIHLFYHPEARLAKEAAMLHQRPCQHIWRPCALPHCVVKHPYRSCCKRRPSLRLWDKDSLQKKGSNPSAALKPLPCQNAANPLLAHSKTYHSSVVIFWNCKLNLLRQKKHGTVPFDWLPVSELPKWRGAPSPIPHLDLHRCSMSLCRGGLKGRFPAVFSNRSAKGSHSMVLHPSNFLRHLLVFLGDYIRFTWNLHQMTPAFWFFFWLLQLDLKNTNNLVPETALAVWRQWHPHAPCAAWSIKKKIESNRVKHGETRCDGLNPIHRGQSTWHNTPLPRMVVVVMGRSKIRRNMSIFLLKKKLNSCRLLKSR